METETISIEDIPGLVEKYHVPLVWYAGRSTTNDQEDLVQETWIRLLGALAANTVIERRTVQAWLYRVLSRLMIDRARHLNRHPMVGMEALGGWEPSSGEWETQVLYLNELKRSVARLHEEWRIILLARAEGYSYSEIGKQVRLSPEAVKGHLYRARQRLAEAEKGAA